MASTIREIADAVVAKIAADWQPTGDDTVERVYLPGVEDIKELAGRQVQVWFEDYGQADIASREQDRNSFVIVVDVYEKCDEQGEPSVAWVDERVDWVEGIWDLLNEARNPPLFPSPLNDVIPAASSRVGSYDPDLLREENLFASRIAITYERDE